MSLFESRYFYTYNGERSRPYLTARGAARAAFDEIDDHPFADGYRVAVNGSVGVKKTRKDALRRAQNLLWRRPVGDTIRAEAVKERSDGSGFNVLDKVYLRQAKVAPPVKDTPGPVGLDRVEGYIEATFKRARWAGDGVCKPNSDHATFSAVDYFDTEANMVAMKNTFLANVEFFDIKYIILFDRIYFANGSSAHYTGVFHSHIHVSINTVGPSAC